MAYAKWNRMKTGLVLLLSVPLFSQTPLSLKDAVRTAIEKHPSVEAAGAQVNAAETRLRQAMEPFEVVGDGAVLSTFRRA